jgi:RNA polymerase sigma factor (sigma-70 family)
METNRTTAAVQRYLNELAGLRGDAPAEPIVRALLACAVHRSYPRLTRGPLNLRSEEVLGAVVERLLKAMRQVRPTTVRQFFALVNQHMRWELNDMARRLDVQPATFPVVESIAAVAPPTDLDSAATVSVGTNMSRILAAIEALPEDEREVFNLVRIQGMSPADAAEVIGVSTRTVHRRLNQGLMLLEERLGDLGPPPSDAPPAMEAGAPTVGA